jgi:hypothetical protein
MWLAPIDGSPVLLYLPTTSDKFAVGRWHGDAWGDDEGTYYVHEPAGFIALHVLERIAAPGATPPSAAQAEGASIADLKPAAPEALAMQTPEAQKWYRLGFEHAKELAAALTAAPEKLEGQTATFMALQEWRSALQGLCQRFHVKAEDCAAEIRARLRPAAPAPHQQAAQAPKDNLILGLDALKQAWRDNCTQPEKLAPAPQQADLLYCRQHGKVHHCDCSQAAQGGEREFRGDNAALSASIAALIELNDAGALFPHGIGGHARTLLATASHRLTEADETIKHLTAALREETEAPVFDPEAARAAQGGREGLTEEQIAQLWAFEWVGDRVQLVRAIERAHGIGITTPAGDSE